MLNVIDDAERPERLEGLDPSTVVLAADLRKKDEITRLFAEAQVRVGGIDILVNNAGIYPRAGVFDIDDALWDEVHDTNLRATFFCAQTAARAMVARGGGRIVNVSSTAAFLGPTKGVHYAASKGGVIALTRSLARSLAPYRIAVNAVAPGVTATAQSALSEVEMEQRARKIPWGRVACPEDVARAVLYLASDFAEYVTGHTLVVDGGAGVPT